MLSKTFVLLAALLILLPEAPPPYPIDGYERTGIRRLAYLRDIVNGDVQGKMPLPGAMKSIDQITLNLAERNLAFPPQSDAELQGHLDALFDKYNPHYSITVMDVTPGREIRYAARKEDQGYQPGSVGKLAVAAGFFTELARLFPDEPAERLHLLRSREVRAGQWALPEHHTIPFYNPETKEYHRRRPAANDVLPLYEWVDHMLSVSSNGAASIIWREAILMRVFGEDYPGLTEEAANEWFRTTPRSEIQDITVSVVNDPLRQLGIGENEWRLGAMFTHNAKNLAPGKGGSTGTPAGLMKYLVAMESGKLVDPWSSLEIKRMIYMTGRRIRYASSPALDNAAVYFKSGSFYSCKQGSSCGDYQGNNFNYMNSVAIVEHPDGTAYLVAMMSNVLNKNSAWDHRVLAAGIDKMMREGKILENPETYSEGKLDTGR